MVALLVGLILVAFAVFSVLPAEWSLNWWNDAIQFLKGGVPILAVFIGLISFFVGIADIKDKVAAKREEEEDRLEAEKAEKSGEADGSASAT
jgi:vacuolar-type H+-ATPase subunit I/STV1